MYITLLNINNYYYQLYVNKILNIILDYFNFYIIQTEEQEVITFLLTTEIIPLCLRIMETGYELTKTLSTFILQKILMDDNGLSYICQTYDRFSHVALILVSFLYFCGKPNKNHTFFRGKWSWLLNENHLLDYCGMLLDVMYVYQKIQGMLMFEYLYSLYLRQIMF